MSETIVPYHAGAIAPAHNIKTATDVAGLCKAIVSETAQAIQGRKYVRVEGWQAIATAHGCVASARDVENIDGGLRCIGEVRRMDTGAVICTAEGFVGDDEKTWAQRPVYARRAMCQTRAISRACRSAFAHVVVMMNAGLETTPAEEVPAEGFEHAKVVSGSAENKTPPARSTAPTSTPRPAAAVTEADVKALYEAAKAANVPTFGIPDALVEVFPYLRGIDGQIHLTLLKPSDLPKASKVVMGEPLEDQLPGVTQTPATASAAPAPSGFREVWPQTITTEIPLAVATIVDVRDPVLGKTGKHGPYKIDVQNELGVWTVDTFDKPLAEACRKALNTEREIAFLESDNPRFGPKLLGVR